MKLSMWDIYHSIDYDDVVPMIQRGQATIDKARLIASSYLDDVTVYVGNANDFFESNADDTLVVHREDMILVRGVDSANVFDEICEIIEKFNEWERSIQQLVDHEDGLQKMLDSSSPILKAPGFVYAPDGRAFAISSDYPPSTHWHWAEIIECGGITSTRMRGLRDSINLPEVWKDTFPKARPSKMGTHKYMHCSLYPNGYMAGHFVLFGFNRPFDKGLERLMNILVKSMTAHMERFYSRYSSTSQMARAFSRYFSGFAFDESDVILFLRALRWSADDTFRVYVIHEKAKSSSVLISQLYNIVTRRFPLAIACIVEDTLVIMENESHIVMETSVAAQLPALIGEDYYCGVSSPFDGIEQCRLYYLQALNELGRCVEHAAISRADEHGAAYLRGILANNELATTYAYSELMLLKHYDVENATDYYPTLRAYVISGFHLSDAARFMGMHRNSLSYRLTRIREIIDFSMIDRLSIFDSEEELYYLLLSFAVIDASE